MDLQSFTSSGLGPQNITPMQRSYEWDLFFPNSFGLLGGVALSKYIQDVRFGNYKMTDIRMIREGAYQSFYAGLMTIDSFTVTFAKGVPDLVYDWLVNWKNLIITPEGYYNPKRVYAKSVFLILGTNNILHTILGNRVKFYNVFPKNLPSHSLSYASNDIVKYDVEFSTSRVEVQGVRDVYNDIKSVINNPKSITKFLNF